MQCPLLAQECSRAGTEEVNNLEVLKEQGNRAMHNIIKQVEMTKNLGHVIPNLEGFHPASMSQKQ